MEEYTSREKVLKNVRNAGIHKAECPYSEIDFSSQVFKQPEAPLDVAFAKAFTAIAGKFVYCADEKEFFYNIKAFAEEYKWHQLYCFEEIIKQMLTVASVPFHQDVNTITEAEQGITFCEFLIARLGSIMVSSAQASGRRLIVYPDTHIVVAYSSQIVADLPDALSGITEKYKDNLPSLISVISGPSRTADIEKTLVMGAHGPRELFLFLIDDNTFE
ncbi:MAG: LUD domain-containing protein [Bacteroidales bacterium]|jgi:L-lactate dehydrogenase complex protein LldG|nr:LUD domain-containing protein [Bacteroidales bacterium]MDD4214029.1 LUD domain-containing protein [Bacteroidales bacterium]